MKKRSKDREPELIQYKLEYSLNDGFPAERFFMALSPKEALEQLLLTCIKSSPFDNFNEQEKEILAEAFSYGSTDLLKKPDLLVIPEALPDKDFPEPESLPPPESKQPIQNESESGENLDFFNTPEEGNQTSPIPEVKPDPAEEYRAKQKERLEEINRAKDKNKSLMEEFENLKSRMSDALNWFKEKLAILTFEEYNRWIDKWISIEYPFSETIIEEEDS